MCPRFYSVWRRVEAGFHCVINCQNQIKRTNERTNIANKSFKLNKYSDDIYSKKKKMLRSNIFTNQTDLRTENPEAEPGPPPGSERHTGCKKSADSPKTDVQEVECQRQEVWVRLHPMETLFKMGRDSVDGSRFSWVWFSSESRDGVFTPKQKKTSKNQE